MTDTPNSGASGSHEPPATPGSPSPGQGGSSSPGLGGSPAPGPGGAPPIGLDALREVGQGLSRPECVLCVASGSLYVSQWGETGGVCEIAPDGTQRLYAGPAPDGRQLRPNGIALRPDGSFLVAHLGAEDGGVFMIDRLGAVRPFIERVDGRDLPPTNFVLEDARGRVWVTVSTRRMPRAEGYRADVDDGFIVLVDRAGARIVADGLGYTNEVALHPSGDWLYVNETFGRRMSRFALRADGSLGARETVTTFGAGSFPDGLCFDAEGQAWVTSIVSNRVIRVAPDGAQRVMLEDSEPEHLAVVEAAYQAATMGRVHLDQARGRRLRNVSSLAFGGPGLRIAYMGCLLGSTLMAFDAPVAGHPPAHWSWG